MRKLSIKQRGIKISLLHDLYYRTLKASWTKFFFVAGVFYLCLNIAFAFLYYFSPAIISNVKSNSLWDLFLFSFQTSTTIGYGYFLPQSAIAHTIVIFDAMIGLFYVAIITGLAFAKFARPSGKILFSDKVVFTHFDKAPALMFRLANGRDTQIVDAKIKISVMLPFESHEGFKMRRFYDLKLLSDNNPTFALSWTAIHQIDDSSPLFGLSMDRLKEMEALFVLSFTGIDDVMSQSIHANYRFTQDKFISAQKFKDILDVESGNYTLDFSGFHEVVI